MRTRKVQVEGWGREESGRGLGVPVCGLARAAARVLLHSNCMWRSWLKGWAVWTSSRAAVVGSLGCVD